MEKVHPRFGAIPFLCSRMASLSTWIDAARPRTLPLAISSILLGSLIAAAEGEFSTPILVLGLLTTLFLQILSNFANDYGDSITGVDNDSRVGPKRTVQRGAISMLGMRSAMFVSAVLAFVFGTWLVIEGVGWERIRLFLLFILLGALAVVSAIKYTVGKRPYGYIGGGDLFVFLFFGLAGVMGIHYLHTGNWDPKVLLPASAFGLIATAVLNLNNLRDRLEDEKNGKRTLAVRLGRHGGVGYQIALLIGVMLLSLLHTILVYESPWQFLYLLSFPLFIANLYRVVRSKDHSELDPELKRVAIGGLLYAVGFGVGMLV